MLLKRSFFSPRRVLMSDTLSLDNPSDRDYNKSGTKNLISSLWAHSNDSVCFTTEAPPTNSTGSFPEVMKSSKLNCKAGFLVPLLSSDKIELDYNNYMFKFPSKNLNKLEVLPQQALKKAYNCFIFDGNNEIQCWRNNT